MENLELHIGDRVRVFDDGPVYTISKRVTTSCGKIYYQFAEDKTCRWWGSDTFQLVAHNTGELDQIEISLNQEGSNPTYINIDNQIIFDKSEFDKAILSDKGNTILIMKSGDRHLINGNHIYEIDFKLRLKC